MCFCYKSNVGVTSNIKNHNQEKHEKNERQNNIEGDKFNANTNATTCKVEMKKGPPSYVDSEAVLQKDTVTTIQPSAPAFHIEKCDDTKVTINTKKL